jgi:hypothetical protein
MTVIIIVALTTIITPIWLKITYQKGEKGTTQMESQYNK